MEKAQKLAVLEIVLEVGLIAILIYFHIEEGKQHQELLDAINGKTTVKK